MSPADEPIPEWAAPAATLIVLRNAHPAPEVLMVERSNAMKFVGGTAVFPGGRLEQQDAVLARRFPALAPDCARARIGAIRETLEETGLLVAVAQALTPDAVAEARSQLRAGTPFGEILDSRGWTLDLERLHWMARWRPPTRKISHVFDTRFFVVSLGTGAVSIEVDGDENEHMFWAQAQDVLAQDKAGKLTLIGPTRANLARLAAAGSIEAVIGGIAAYPPKVIMPQLARDENGPWVGVPEGHGYPPMRFVRDAAGVVEAIENETAAQENLRGR